MHGQTTELAGRVALVSGGGRGIGRAIALALARHGATVAVAARTSSEVRAVAAECEGGAMGMVLDVREESSCEEAVARCHRELGGPHVLVAAAGVSSSEKFTDLTLDRWRETMAIDLDGTFLLIRSALPSMLEAGWGRVVSIGSTASRAGAPYVAAYTAAKHGVLGLTRSLAAEYAKSGVTFNCVCPGFADTPMTEQTIRNIVTSTGRVAGDARRAIMGPQGRLIEPAEIADLCVFLASDRGRSINGQAITIDGGGLLA